MSNSQNPANPDFGRMTDAERSAWAQSVHDACYERVMARHTYKCHCGMTVSHVETDFCHKCGTSTNRDVTGL